MSGWRINDIPAFCITLQRRPDRWKTFIDQPALESLPHVKRFNGTDGKKIDIRTDRRIPLVTRRNILANMRRTHEELDTPGGVGCALSHIAAWKWLAESNDHDMLLIFEDDAKIPADFVSRVNGLIERSPLLRDTSKWEMLNFTHQVGNPTPIKNEPSLETIDAFVGLQCYVLTKTAAQRLFEQAFPVHLHIDLWMGVFHTVYGLKMIHPTTISVGQRTSKTDIQNEKDCEICNVDTGFEKTHALVRHEDLFIARVAEIVVVAGAAYFAYQYLFKK